MPRRTGFTLIELLVVLVIFAIAAGLVSLRLLPDDGELARHEAEASALLIERAADEAERTGRPLAWHPDGAASRFEVPDDQGRWVALTDDAEFAARALPGELRWGALHFPQAAGAATAFAGDANDIGTRVVFLPGQAVSPFRVAIGTEAHPWLLSGDATGHVQVEAAQ